MVDILTACNSYYGIYGVIFLKYYSLNISHQKMYKHKQRMSILLKIKNKTIWFVYISINHAHFQMSIFLKMEKKIIWFVYISINPCPLSAFVN